jgi:galactokinase
MARRGWPRRASPTECSKMMPQAKANAVYQIVQGNAGQLPDVDAFIRTLSTLATHGVPEARTLFDPRAELFVARAPGRLDVMGGIADYSGSLVLELPIAEATLVALQKDDTRRVRIVSMGDNGQRVSVFEMSLAEFEHDGEPIDYETARRYFAATGGSRWAAYVAGVFLVLMRECGVRFAQGSLLLICSAVSEGKGVSSSAALEVATMSAVAAAFSITLEPRKLALLCQQVENLVVGAPCGVMDQMTSACGEEHQLLALLCQPAEILETIKLPDELAVWGLDSGVSHSIGGADYSAVRTGAFIGYRIIAELAGLKIKQIAPTVLIEDERWNGFLANIPVSEFEDSYAPRLPEKIAGSEFLKRYGGTTDPITRIEPEKNYAVRIPAAHAVHESFRVRTFAELLRCRNDRIGEQQRLLLGELMYQSHASYSACGLGSSSTDTIVRLVKDAGEDRGLYGAKITGGGSGGTVVVLGRRDAATAIREIADQFAALTGHMPHIFSGSSAGSASFGHLRLRPQT